MSDRCKNCGIGFYNHGRCDHCTHGVGCSLKNDAAAKLKRLAEILLPEIESEREYLDAGHEVEIWLFPAEAREVVELLK